MLEAERVCFRYRPDVPLIEAVDLTVAPGEIVGLTGISGRGKSTLGRLLARHLRPSSGRITVDGAVPRGGYDPVQYLPQSPLSGIDPRWRIGRIVEEAWTPDAEARDRAGVLRAWYDRFPHEVSGGELQRVAILRAVGPATRYLVADEITAMLDPATQASIWSWLRHLARDRGVGLVVISHNAHLVRRVCDREVAL